MKREVKIAVKAAAYAKLDDFVWFQGELKTLSEENYQKLRAQILELGFSEAPAVWIDGDALKLLNGHQRILTLRKMQDEGFRIPMIPYQSVTAENEEEAKRKVLSLTSQFGEITEKGIREFISDTTITVDEINNQFVFPGLEPLEELEPVEKIVVEVRNHTRELAEEDFQNFEHKCPKCGFEFDEKS